MFSSWFVFIIRAHDIVIFIFNVMYNMISLMMLWVSLIFGFGIRFTKHDMLLLLLLYLNHIFIVSHEQVLNLMMLIL